MFSSNLLKVLKGSTEWKNGIRSPDVETTPVPITPRGTVIQIGFKIPSGIILFPCVKISLQFQTKSKLFLVYPLPHILLSSWTKQYLLVELWLAFVFCPRHFSDSGFRNCFLIFRFSSLNLKRVETLLSTIASLAKD